MLFSHEAEVPPGTSRAAVVISVLSSLEAFVLIFVLQGPHGASRV